MYGKIFASAFTGSMFGAGADVFALWSYVIANTVDSTIELNPVLLAATIGSTPEKMKSAIEYLCRPDSLSRNQDHDGCRLVHEGAFQYHVVSHTLYRAMRDNEELRAYNRAKQRESRAARQKAPKLGKKEKPPRPPKRLTHMQQRATVGLFVPPPRK